MQWINSIEIGDLGARQVAHSIARLSRGVLEGEGAQKGSLTEFHMRSSCQKSFCKGRQT